MRTLRLLMVWTLLAALSGCANFTGLPQIPDDLTAEDVGMADLQRALDEARVLGTPVNDEERASFAAQPPQDALQRARWALHRLAAEDFEDGLRLLGEALESDPESLVLGNAYRVAVHHLKLRARAEARRRGEFAARLPDPLRSQPQELLEAIAARAPGPQIELQIALAQVDKMVLNPALEIKAPASIESTRLLTLILKEHPYYVPALYARGLNYLFRPRKLVWPEKPKPPADAGSKDLARAAAAAMKVGGAPPRLRALVLTTLGDSYAHEENMGQARSWWLLARESGADAATLREIGMRMTWSDAEAPDRLEAHLEERMADQQHPLSDLSFLWSEQEDS